MDAEKIVMKITIDRAIDKAKTRFVNTEMLDKAYYSDGYFENFDSSPLAIDLDYHGTRRNVTNPKVGPFESLKEGDNEIILWRFGQNRR